MEVKLSFREPIYERIFELALPYLQTRDNELHTRVAYRFAERLLSGEGGDEGIALPAVLLHDIGWIRVPEHLQLTAFGPKMTNPELRDVHEQEGAEMARKILAEVGYPPDKAEVITRIISRHDSRPDAESLEEGIVKDADKLFRYSREGFPAWAPRFGLSMEEYLSRLEGAVDRWFLTETGKKIVRAEVRARRRELGMSPDLSGSGADGS